jgi:hypothetical protein
MKWNNLFKSRKRDINRDSTKSIDSEAVEISISSDQPYHVLTDQNEEDIMESRTFTESLEMKTENMHNSIKIPVKVYYDAENLFQLILYLPDAKTNRKIRELNSNDNVDLWIFLENGEFFIIFPEFINPYMDNEGIITVFQLNLSNTGFHSELKELANKYSPEEICRIVRTKLTTIDIAEIDPKILCNNNDTIDCPEISVSPGSCAILKKAFNAVQP